MARNPIPESYDAVVALAEDAADGADTHGLALGLKQNTEVSIRADLTALIVAQGAVANQRLAKAAASNARKVADSNAKTFIALFINTMKPRFGNAWGPLWEQAGFTNGSIRNPSTVDERFVLLGKLKNFLSNHIEYNITDPGNPAMDVTNTVAETLYEACSTTRSAYNEAANDNGANLAARDAALTKTRNRLTGLREELIQLPLAGDSPIWYAFGFSRPDDPETPEVPSGLILTAGAPGSGDVITDWAASRRATSYRVKIQVAGETEPRLFGLFEDDQATIHGLPLGVLLTITIIAHNAAGDSQESTPATITLV